MYVYVKLHPEIYKYTGIFFTIVIFSPKLVKTNENNVHVTYADFSTPLVCICGSVYGYVCVSVHMCVCANEETCQLELHHGVT